MYYRGKKSVLRKKPAGQLLSSTAHQVEREYRVLNALHKHNIKPGTPPEKRVPVPSPYAICEDCSILGTPFYIMKFVDGRIFTDPYMPQLDPKDRREWCVSSFVGVVTALRSTQLVRCSSCARCAIFPFAQRTRSRELWFPERLLPSSDKISDEGFARAIHGDGY